jgi:hypothetical protein
MNKEGKEGHVIWNYDVFASSYPAHGLILPFRLAAIRTTTPITISCDHIIEAGKPWSDTPTGTAKECPSNICST